MSSIAVLDTLDTGGTDNGQKPFLATPQKKAPDPTIGDVQLIETIEHAHVALVAPPVLATTLVPFFWASPWRDIVIGDAGAVCVIALIALGAARASARVARRSKRTKTGRRIAALFACALGGAFAVLPALLYSGADHVQRLLLLGTLCGAIGNVALMGAAWPVGLAYVLPLIAGGVVGFGSAHDAGSITLAALLTVTGCVVGVLLDINRKLASSRLRVRREVNAHAFTIDRLLLDFEETDEEWLWETDERGRLTRVTARMAATIGLDSHDLEGKHLKSVLNQKPRRETRDSAINVLESVRQHEPFRNRVVAIETDGGLVWWRLSGRPTQDDLGRFVGFRGIGADITEARNADARIAYLANHDPVTGLHNRTSFHAHAKKECDAASQTGRGGALLSIDLDGFKGVNDRLGHAAGDEVLKEVARRLSIMAPSDTIVGRLGGDEFAVWCPTTVPSKAIEVADRLIDAIRTPFVLRDGAQIDIGASIGIALTPKHADDPNMLLVRADLALYRAKAEGKGLSRLFLEDYERQLIDKRSLEADVKLALARQEFELHYQPILDLTTGMVTSFETLIRWRSPTRGFVSPADFIPAAETGGLIVAVDRWVLSQACKHAAIWPEEIHVAVNISPDHFRSGDLLQDVRLALQFSGLAARRLCIEVTEGVFLDGSQAAIDTLHSLRTLGVQIALDDFGTGYSSLSYLVRFPIDKIKIDRAFVRDFTERHESRAIVDAILSLARKLEIEVVAEGVETGEQALALKLRRCDHIQGFLLSKAMPYAEVETMLLQVPDRYREVVPIHVDSALGMALALKKHAV